MADIVVLPPSPAAEKPAAPAPAPVAVTVRPVAGQENKKNTFGGSVEMVRETAKPAEPAPAPAILGKFKSHADLEKAYVELEQRLGSVGQKPAPASEPAAPAQGEPAPPAEAPAASRDLVARMTQEYAASGQVSPALRAEFKKAYPGLDERFIDNQVSYLKAQGSRASELAVARLGGESAVRELMTWAGSRLTEPERAAFNRAVYSGDEAMAQFAVDGLAAKYEMEVGRSPRIMAGRKPQEQFGGIQPYQSPEEWRRAMKDPKYRQDPAYRQEVEDRLRVAVNLGIIPA